MSNDHTDAATITPEAKPNSDFCTRADISSFIKKTRESMKLGCKGNCYSFIYPR